MQCRHVCMRDSKYSAKRAKTTFTRFVLLVLLSSCKMLYIYNHAKNLEPSLYRCIYITHTYIYIPKNTCGSYGTGDKDTCTHTFHVKPKGKNTHTHTQASRYANCKHLFFHIAPLQRSFEDVTLCPSALVAATVATLRNCPNLSHKIFVSKGSQVHEAYAIGSIHIHHVLEVVCLRADVVQQSPLPRTHDSQQLVSRTVEG